MHLFQCEAEGVELFTAVEGVEGGQWRDHRRLMRAKRARCASASAPDPRERGFARSVSLILAGSASEAHALLAPLLAPAASASAAADAAPTGADNAHADSVMDVLLLALAGLAQRQLRQHAAADATLARGREAILSLLDEEADNALLVARVAQFPVAFLGAIISMACCLEDEVRPWQLFFVDLTRVLLSNSPDHNSPVDVDRATVPEDAKLSTASAGQGKKSGKQDAACPWVLRTERDITVLEHTRDGTRIVLAESGSSGMFRFRAGKEEEQMLCGVSGKAWAGVDAAGLRLDVIGSIESSIKTGGGEKVTGGWSWGAWRIESEMSKAHQASLFMIAHVQWPPACRLTLTDTGKRVSGNRARAARRTAGAQGVF